MVMRDPIRGAEDEREREKKKAAIEAQTRWFEEDKKLPKRQVVLTVSCQRLTRPARYGVHAAEYEMAPPGTPLEVTHEEFARLRGLGYIDEREMTRLGLLTDSPQSERGARQAVHQRSRNGSEVEIVSSAQSRSGTSPAEWDALSDDEREQLTDAEIARRRAAANHGEKIA